MHFTKCRKCNPEPCFGGYWVVTCIDGNHSDIPVPYKVTSSESGAKTRVHGVIVFWGGLHVFLPELE